jgi:chromosome segregation ATPase
MNAVICDEYEARVLTNEAIEVHLQYLRSGFDGVQAALPILRDKIDQLSAQMDAKIDKTNDRIDAVEASLGEKIEKTNDRIDAVGASLSEKMDKTSDKFEERFTSLEVKIEARDKKVNAMIEDFAGVRAMQKATLWLLGAVVALVPIGVTIAKTLHWI